MALEVSVDFPQFPKDYEFDIGGILVPNGKSVKLDEDQEQSFVARHHSAVKEHFEGTEHVKVTGTPKYSPSEVSKIFPEPEPPQALTAAEEEAAQVKEGSES